jgi:hypothetical protein
MNAQDMNNSLLYIENGGTRVGILSEVGGRIVYLSSDDSPNILKATEKFWNEDSSERPIPSFDTDWKEYNGHIVWLGPQSEWWTRQDGNMERKKSKAEWPADPSAYQSW